MNLIRSNANNLSNILEDYTLKYIAISKATRLNVKSASVHPGHLYHKLTNTLLSYGYVGLFRFLATYH